LPLIGLDDAWAVTRAGVYFTSNGHSEGEGGPGLEFYGFGDRKVRRLTSLPGVWKAGGIAVSRDDHWLLFTRSAPAESAIMLMDLKP
jgi:hypothetical protein